MLKRTIRKVLRMRLTIFLISVLVIGFAQAAVYKYTNKQGKTTYSDIPVEGAETVIVPPIMTYEAPVIPTRKATTSDQPKVLSEEFIPYSYIDIITPSEQGTVRSNQGIVNVTYKLQPALKEGDHVELFVDGIIQESFNVQGLVRGAHVVAVHVVNKDGQLQIRSSEVTFYLQHNSRL